MNESERGTKPVFVWNWDPVLVLYHNVVATSYKNMESIYSSLWAKIFKSLAKKKLKAEMDAMDWANMQIEKRIKELEADGYEVFRKNTLTGEYLS
jgi:hypothetical protein